MEEKKSDLKESKLLSGVYFELEHNRIYTMTPEQYGRFKERLPSGFQISPNPRNLDGDDLNITAKGKSVAAVSIEGTDFGKQKEISLSTSDPRIQGIAASLGIKGSPTFAERVSKTNDFNRLLLQMVKTIEDRPELLTPAKKLQTPAKVQH